VTEHVERMRGMLRGAMPPHVEIVTARAPSAAWVEADPDQLEQVVLNLALNAGDAMVESSHGTLTLRVLTVDADGRNATRLDVPPGAYVVVEVVDTGVGIDPQRMRHIFEPFYTTKPGHAGSGLGLAAVYGIVKQSGGNVTVESTPGKGSTFRVALPVAQAPRDPATIGEAAAPASNSARASGHETVLVVDDDELVRRLTALMLEVQGYRVLVASDPEHALRIAVEHDGPIHLVLTDVMMPTLAGGALVERLLPIRPDLRVLFVSGYVDEVASPMPVPQSARMAFLQKPVTPEELATKIRALLDG
jgi:two-component system cell cycle sensor histidine kinase/response regulator CckA